MNLQVTNLEIDDWFKQLDKPISMWITDPPYPFNEQNGTNRYNGMYQKFTWSKLSDVFVKMYDKTEDGGRAYVFANRDGLFQTRQLLESAGFEFLNFLIWDKMALGGGYHWRNSIEYIVYVSKNRPKVFVKGVSNVFHYKKPTLKDAVPSINYIPNGTSPKPYHIWKDILENGSFQGDNIADPFAGSNPLRAALLLNVSLQSKVNEVYTNIYLT